MAIVVLLKDGEDPAVVLSSLASARLAALGVTSVSVVRDRRSVGVILEGWAFDPATAPAAADELFGSVGRPVRTLREVIHVAVMPPDGDAAVSIEGGA